MSASSSSELRERQDNYLRDVFFRDPRGLKGSLAVAGLDLQAADPNAPVRVAKHLQVLETLEREVADLQGRLESEPQAAVPERDAARKLRDAASAKLAEPGVGLDAAGAAVGAFAEAVPPAIDAMRRVRAEQTRLAELADALQSPDDVDDLEDAEDLARLAGFREQIAALLTVAEPSAQGLKEAAVLIETHEESAEALRRAVAERLAQRSTLMLKQAAAAFERLGRIENVDVSMAADLLERHGALKKLLAGPALTVQIVKDAQTICDFLCEAARAKAEELEALATERSRLEQALSQIGERPKLPKEAAEKIKQASSEAGTALTIPLSPDSVAEASRKIEAYANLIGIARQAEPILLKTQELFTRHNIKQIGTTDEQNNCLALRNRILKLCNTLQGDAIPQANETLLALQEEFERILALDSEYQDIKQHYGALWSEIYSAYNTALRAAKGADLSGIYETYGELSHNYYEHAAKMREIFDPQPIEDILRQLKGLIDDLYRRINDKDREPEADSDELQFVLAPGAKTQWQDAEMTRLCGLIEQPGQAYFGPNHLLQIQSGQNGHAQGAGTTKFQLDTASAGAGSRLRGYFRWTRKGNVVTVTPGPVTEEHGGKGNKIKVIEN